MKEKIEKKEKQKKKKQRDLNLVQVDKSVPLEERQEKRKVKRKSRRKKIKYILIILLLAAAVAASVYYVDKTGFFNISTIEVKGNSYLEVQKILETSKAQTGVNILTINTGDIKENLYKEPYVKEVKIKRKLPDTLEIIIKERKEKSAVSLSGYYILMDEEGIVLRKSNDHGNLITIEGFMPQEVVPGKAFAANDASNFRAILKVIEDTKAHGITISKIQFNNGIIKVNFTDKLLCETTPANLRNNLAQLKEILYDLESKGIKRGIIHIGNNSYFSFSPQIE